MRPRTLLPALVALALLAGCVKSSPPMVLHTLAPVAPKAGTPGKALVLEVLPVRLPELLRRSQIVIQEGEGRHRLSGTHRWGNPLESDMQRVIAENLSALLGQEAVVAYPLPVKASHRITVDVQQCDGTPGGMLVFRCTWIIAAPDGRVERLHKTAIQEPINGPDMAAFVAAHNQALLRVSQEIAEGVLALP